MNKLLTKILLVTLALAVILPFSSLTTSASVTTQTRYFDSEYYDADNFIFYTYQVGTEYKVSETIHSSTYRALQIGLKIYVVPYNESQYELTTGTYVAVAEIPYTTTTNITACYNATWSPQQLNLARQDKLRIAIYKRVKVSTFWGAWSMWTNVSSWAISSAYFMTESLGMDIMTNQTSWVAQYWIRSVKGTSTYWWAFLFGDTEYNSRIDNMSFDDGKSVLTPYTAQAPINQTRYFLNGNYIISWQSYTPETTPILSIQNNSDLLVDPSYLYPDYTFPENTTPDYQYLGFQLGAKIWLQDFNESTYNTYTDGLPSGIELSGGNVVAIVSRNDTGEGYQTATFTMPQVNMSRTQYILIAIYLRSYTHQIVPYEMYFWYEWHLLYTASGLNPYFATENLGMIGIQSSTWLFTYYTKVANASSWYKWFIWYFGDTDHASKIENIIFDDGYISYINEQQLTALALLGLLTAGGLIGVFAVVIIKKVT